MVFEGLLLTVLITGFVLTNLWLVSDFSPLFIVLLPIGLLCLYAIGRIKGGYILSYLLLCITFLENSDGIQLVEIPFYIANLLLVFYTVAELIRGNLTITNKLDVLALLFLLLIPYALIMGILNGGALYLAIGESTYFFGLLIYFPLRKYLADSDFRKMLFIVLSIIIIYAFVRNVINYRAIILSAVLPWEAENARAAANEFLFLSSSIFFVALAAITKQKYIQALSTILFFLALGGLILTQSRGYWLAFTLSAFALFVFINKKGKIRMLSTFLLTAVPALIFLQLFFSQELQLIIGGMTDRLLTIFSGTMDWSLKERVLESQQVFDKITQSPISGHGFGVKFTKKLLFYDTFIQTSYVHNGYLATWFKFGLPGLLIIYSFWGFIVMYGVRLYKSSSTVIIKAVAISAFSIIIGMALVNNTSPQVLNFESVLFVAIIAAYISSHHQKINEKNESVG
jgi:O-antigen ligase